MLRPLSYGGESFLHFTSHRYRADGASAYGFFKVLPAIRPCCGGHAR